MALQSERADLSGAMTFDAMVLEDSGDLLAVGDLAAAGNGATRPIKQPSASVSPWLTSLPANSSSSAVARSR